MTFALTSSSQVTPSWWEIITKLYPVVDIKEKVKDKLLTGKPNHYNDLIKKVDLETNKMICVFCKEQFIEVARVVNEKDIFAKPEFIFQHIEN